MRAEIKRINNNGLEWIVNVFLTKVERQKLLNYLSMYTNEALKNFQNENEVILAQAAQKDFNAILTMYPYPDLNEISTTKDNCYAVIPVTRKGFIFDTESRLDEKERKILENNIMASLTIPYYYEIINKITKEIEYGTLHIV